MSLSYDEIHSIIINLGFGITDFITSRNSRNIPVPISCISDVCDELLSINNNEKIINSVDKTLTKKGIEKFNNAKTLLRKHKPKESIKKTDDFIYQTEHINEVVVLCNGKSLNVKEFRSKQIQFINNIQDWGKFDISDHRYYLHMVFRYYLNEYQKLMIKRGSVIAFPSYQNILDNISPNGCKNGFPPEFISFLKDSAGRSFDVRTLPVPIKGCGKNVTFEYNFEEIPDVSSFRRMIYYNFLKWEEYYTKYNICIFPEFLISGNENNSVIYEAALKSKRNETLKKDIRKLDSIDKSKMDEIIKLNKNIVNAYDKYSTHSFETAGEQLDERFGYFVFNRSSFYCMDGFVDIFFQNSTSRMDVYINIKNFCDKNESISFSKNQVVMREMLISLKEIIYIFHLYSNISFSSDNNILKDCIKNLS